MTWNVKCKSIVFFWSEVYFHSSVAFTFCHSLTHTDTLTPHITTFSSWDMLHAPGDPPLISKPHTIGKNWFRFFQSRTVHRRLRKAAMHDLVDCPIDLPFPRSPTWAFALVCYALTSPHLETSPMGKVGNILKTCSTRNTLLVPAYATCSDAN